MGKDVNTIITMLKTEDGTGLRMSPGKEWLPEEMLMG